MIDEIPGRPPHQGRLGYKRLVEQLEHLIAQVKQRVQTVGPTKPVPIAQPKGEVVDRLSVSYPKQRVSDMMLPRCLSDWPLRVHPTEFGLDQAEAILQRNIHNTKA
jgi:hypothetical protein